jgi:hypothetical protein
VRIGSNVRTGSNVKIGSNVMKIMEERIVSRVGKESKK